MSRLTVTGLSLGLAFMAVAMLGYAPAGADGQVVFVPQSGPPTGQSEHVEPLIEIHRCGIGQNGLEVQGQVRSSGSTVTVAVWDSDERVAGVRVGQAYARHAALLEDASVGDFVVVLPWASPDARFAVVEEDGFPDIQHSAGVTTCPE